MATEPAPMTLDRNDGSATMELYRATLGPVHTDKYLKVFTRFDAAGQSGLSWNWSAALLTLNWMLFRRLWLHALAYAGIVAGALLLLFGIARLLFQLPDASLWALAGLGVVLSVVVPGAYGDAWLYAACNKAMDKALPASTTLEEACAELRKRSPGKPHWIGLAIGNAVLAAVVAGLLWSGKSAVPAEKSESASRSSQGLVQPAPAPQASAVAGVASAPASLASAAMPVAEAVAVPAAPPASAASQAASQAASLVAAPASASVAQEPAKPSKAELQAKALEAKKEKAEKAKAEKEAKAAKKAQEAQAAKEAKEAKEVKAAKEAKVKSAAQATASAASAAAAAAPASYLINVGLFADPNNARNAYTKLQDAGLPAQIKELKSAKGPQIRVRAGPFDSEAEADRAADTIRGLKLDAVVIRP